MNPPRNIVIVGASLAGLRAAEALRDQGFDGALTLIGDEKHEPYDRPPLSKQVLSGWAGAHETALPRLRAIDAEWRLGYPATRVARRMKQVFVGDGGSIPYDRLVVATGTRARRWPIASEASLAGVHVLRTREDAAALTLDLHAKPNRVLVIGAGFTGSEIASACRELDVAVTVIEINSAPLLAAVGDLVASHAARLQRDAGVDLRCDTRVERLVDDGAGRVIGARLSSGETIEASVVVVCMGAVRNVEWLADAELDTNAMGVACDQHCRALDRSGAASDDIFVCGDVSRFRHALFENTLLSLEHWGNAIEQAAVVAANIMHPGSATTDSEIPRFWSMQFGANFKCVGLPSSGDKVAIVQGSMESGRFVAAYGRGDRIVGAVAVNQAQWLPFYEAQIVGRGAFPPDYRVVDQPADLTPRPVKFVPRMVETPVPVA